MMERAILEAVARADLILRAVWPLAATVAVASAAAMAYGRWSS